MATYREFPIINAASQTFSTVLMGKRCDFDVNYSSSIDRWSFSLSIDGTLALSGRRIVLGTDLIAPFEFGIGKLFALDWERSGVVPGRSELPSGRVRFIHYEQDTDA